MADNARLERELVQLRRALQAQRQNNAPTHPAPATAMLEDGKRYCNNRPCLEKAKILGINMR